MKMGFVIKSERQILPLHLIVSIIMYLTKFVVKKFQCVIVLDQATVDLPQDSATRIGWSQLYGE